MNTLQIYEAYEAVPARARAVGRDLAREALAGDTFARECLLEGDATFDEKIAALMFCERLRLYGEDDEAKYTAHELYHDLRPLVEAAFEEAL